MYQPSHSVCQKYVGKCKDAIKMCMTVLKMHITRRLINVTEMFANCGWQNAVDPFPKLNKVNVS